MEKYLGPKNQFDFEPIVNQYASQPLLLPIQSLSLSQTQITDTGFLFLCKNLDVIFSRSEQQGREIQGGLILDVGCNLLADSAIKEIARLLANYSGIRSLVLNNI